jgi:peptide/nickel transport system substrate-binding protein
MRRSAARSGIDSKWAVVVVLATALVLASCGGGDDDGEGADSTEDSVPQSGGKVVYGLGAETPGGWCLPEAQLAQPGIQVARTIYDTLTVPDENGDFQPYLAESVTPNEDFTEFTIVLRPDITFHDDTPLDATVVKNNLDAFRGAYPARKPLLFSFVFSNVADVAVVDPMTVKVTTKSPWPSFPAYLFSNGRLGIMAQAQLDDPDNCETELIGTGPFELEEWKVNDRFVAVRNPDYWQTDAEGDPLPYLDEIEYRIYVDGDARINALISEELNAMETATALELDALQEEVDAGDVDMEVSGEFADVSYMMLNTAKPPFDNLDARLAVAYAVDRETYREVRSLDLFDVASGPFAPGETGYLEDAGFPQFDLDKAREHVAAYEEQTGQPLKFSISSTTDPIGVQNAQFLQEQIQQAGAEVSLDQQEAATLINNALAGNFNAVMWLNHPGGEPDQQYVWWYGGSPVNFGRFDDPEINRLLDEGRQEPDPDEANAIYQDINRRFAEQAYNIWLMWPEWAIATAPDVGGLYGPDLPGGGKPMHNFANGHAVLGMYVEG